jgi:hypothetical protein
MLRKVLLWRVLPVVLAILAGAGAIGAVDGSDATAAGSERLPDLDQELPSGLTVTRLSTHGRAVHVLGFRSAVRNVGDGPLVFEGHRAGVDRDTMVADQLIEREGAPRLVVRGAGELRYVISPDHRHWHLLGFDRYQLRRAGQERAAVRDRKSGFCLGDRYEIPGRRLPAAPAQPRYTSRCGLDAPGLLAIEEGISVGYGDDYAANLEGQYLRLTGLPAGRYVLVHRTNADRRLRELDYTNDAASLLLRLRWRGGAPTVRILRQCPDTDRCRPARR